jgi:hypothetical protein
MFRNIGKMIASQVAKSGAAQAQPAQKTMPQQVAKNAMSAVRKFGRFAEGGVAMSDAEKQAREEMAERKMQEKTEKAYSKSLTNTEYAPAKKDPRDAVRGQKGYSKGGVTRADGIAKRGKTRGKMC